MIPRMWHVIIIIVCFSLFSCESIIEGLLSDSPSNSANTSQNGTQNTPSQTATNTPAAAGDSDSANWNTAALDTARNVNYLTTLEKDVILEMNKVRTNPRKYAEMYIRPMLKYFNGTRYSVPGQITIITEEGAAAVNECIAALNKASAVSVLTPERGLSLAAKDHVTDMRKTGQTGHTGSDGSTVAIRIRRHGTLGSVYTHGENIMYGSTSGREIIVDLLIDDGIPSRGHRSNIMDSDFTQAGVAYGTHPRYETSCVIDFANGYKSN